MPSQKHLKGIAHDLGDHAASGLSYLHPHLGEAVRQAGGSSAHISLLDADPYPAGLPRLRPLEVAINSLREWFDDLLAREGFPQDDVAGVELDFTFRDDSVDNFDSAVEASIVSRCGDRFIWSFDFYARDPSHVGTFTSG